MFRSFKMHRIVRGTMTLRRRTPPSSITSFPTSPFSMIRKNFRFLVRQITPSVGGTTQSMLHFFIQWHRMITLTQRSLRKSFLNTFGLLFLTNSSPRQIVYEIEHGVQQISESEWPAFLYPQGTDPDVEDDQAGLFRGYLLPRVSFISYVVYLILMSTVI